MMDDNSVLVAVILVIISCCLAYDKLYLESVKDVHELSLTEQASISTTRKAGESAIYRSLDVMHGLPLTVGLQVRYDVYKIRNGNLKDVWKLAMAHGSEHKKISFVMSNGQTRSLSLLEFNLILYKVSTIFTKSSGLQKIGFHHPWASLEAFALIFSCFFYTNHSIHNMTKIPKLKDDNISMICCLSLDVPLFAALGYTQFLVFDDLSLDLENCQIVSFSQLLANVEGPEDASHYNYVYSKEDDLQKVLVDTLNYKETEYTLINFVSSIASQLRSLPMEHCWSDQDKVMVEADHQIPSSSASVLLNQGVLIKVLSSLVAGVQAISIASTKELSLDLINTMKPSILSVSEETLASKVVPEISEIVCKVNPWQKLLLKLSCNWFSRGIHNSKIFKVDGIPQLRILYSELVSPTLSLSSSQLNELQAIFGTRIVSEKFKLPLLGPILKTNFFDYRILENDTTSDGKVFVRKLGVAANCLELKVADKGKLLAENNEGELICRGFNIGKVLEKRVEGVEPEANNEGWMPLGLTGKFGEDGCFYQYA